MKTTIIDYKGGPIKVCDGVVSLLGFGTTINNHTMHHSWTVVPLNKLSDELLNFLKSEGLL
jgi:hypothetical protein